MHKFIFKTFLKNKKLFWLGSLKFLLKYNNFFKLGVRKFYFLKYKKLVRVSFSQNIRKSCFLKYKEFFPGFHCPKYKKSFLLRKYKKFLNIRARMFHFLKYKKIFRDGFFFIFSRLGLKSATGSCILYYY